MTRPTIGLLGLGEVGQLLAADLPQSAHEALVTWDLKLPDPDSIPSKALPTMNVTAMPDAASLAVKSDIILCAVTAEETLNAANSVAPNLRDGAWYFDMNSASPGQKVAASNAIHTAGGRYVEGAVMSPAAAKRLAMPILLGGPHAAAFEPIARAIGFSGTTVFSDIPGKASAAKMCRSVMVKGVEALLTESMLSARHYGVEDTVIQSLSDLFPGPDWSQLTPYMISRSIEHGGRRAEEMREVAKTVAEAGLPPLMSSATAERQDLTKAYTDTLDARDLSTMLDTILARMETKE
ncbi:MAG: DUF1932 domain-containing protein [Alphaproteobacteria bacterium]